MVADSQLLLRLDQGSQDPINATSEQALLDRLAALWQGCDAVIVSDYCYGILTPRIIQALTQWQGLAPRPLVVDARQLSAYREVGVTAVQPNYQEALQLLGELSSENLSSEDFSSEKRVEQITAHGPRLLELAGARLAAISLDCDGALIFEHGHPVHRTYAPAIPEAHPAGAGDTFVSAFTLALAAGAAPSLAADLASAAAAVVVAQAGTTACSGADLQSSLELLNRSLR
ncbi:PfkB family carbohydrate kinase [Leptolyngbya sp. FACHB-261]|uniref:PfkB family carbohydrate kinase n=1 Tax=Leptolyngbya sp. FACHB-261 TaxID=2692806 RepID=UPI001686E364|nr:PfkB family carbohydrate kinase [Leptolyngbya sp. FACHB-261]MBD2101977.1 bifunctional hydroxymethylpyrimidine kinase/phosphomethylpyrimidine kinase [Leptolyngbya sp. FACHB-261]